MVVDLFVDAVVDEEANEVGVLATFFKDCGDVNGAGGGRSRGGGGLGLELRGEKEEGEKLSEREKKQ